MLTSVGGPDGRGYMVRLGTAGVHVFARDFGVTRPAIGHLEGWWFLGKYPKLRRKFKR